MLVVFLADLVVGLPVSQVDTPDLPLALHRRDSAKDGRIIRGAELLAHGLMHLVDRPQVSRVAVERLTDGVCDWAGSRHVQMIDP
jgi:hypothetical protein